MKTIALLTDFGLQDIYVGVMKAVMRSICPSAEFIDLTHAIPPQSVRGGAIALRNSYSYCPTETVFLVIVDPGVGSTRRPIAVRAGGYTFVAPDNGVLSYALAEIGGEQTAVILENPSYRRQAVSATFHGRDVFAPAAAYLARGDVALHQMGQAIHQLAELPAPTLQVDGKRISGEVTHIDHFGNIITSIGELRWVDEGRLVISIAEQMSARLVADHVTVRIGDETIYGILHAYHEIGRGGLMAQVDSNGYLEIAVNQGDAARRLNVTIGDPLELVLDDGD
ncbi:MAG: SAM-dependent chlorinase/fluorinase [Anaerolineae bacterium]|nr:SAM-dependent chlorinase/fluorinase [Anaerolineae bacterium]MDW8173249.1 SAM-dependent chlorinase/fluorinase [Anaerolineae bacterium]